MEHYTPIFKRPGKPSNKINTLRESLATLKSIKRTLKEDESKQVIKAIDSAIDSIETIITDIIDAAGATNPAVSTLIDTVAGLETSQDVAEISAPDMSSDFIMEAEEKDEEDCK